MGRLSGVKEKLFLWLSVPFQVSGSFFITQDFEELAGSNFCQTWLMLRMAKSAGLNDLSPPELIKMHEDSSLILILDPATSEVLVPVWKYMHVHTLYRCDWHKTDEHRLSACSFTLINMGSTQVSDPVFKGCCLRKTFMDFFGIYPCTSHFTC